MISVLGKVTSVCLLTATLVLGIAGTAFAASSGTTAPAAHAARDQTLTGFEIWRIVEPHHRIVCADAARELKRISRAEASTSTRLARAQARLTKAQGVRPAALVRRRTAKVKGFEKLRTDGTALVAKIDAKCKVATPAA